MGKISLDIPAGRFEAATIAPVCAEPEGAPTQTMAAPPGDGPFPWWIGLIWGPILIASVAFWGLVAYLVVGLVP